MREANNALRCKTPQVVGAGMGANALVLAKGVDSVYPDWLQRKGLSNADTPRLNIDAKECFRKEASCVSGQRI